MTEESKVVFSIEFASIFLNPEIENFSENRKCNL